MTAKEQYGKQRRRIQSYISKLRRQGYSVDFVLPNIPKRITPASVRRLERITPEKIRKNATVFDVETGRLITVDQVRERDKERKRQIREANRKLRKEHEQRKKQENKYKEELKKRQQRSKKKQEDTLKEIRKTREQYGAVAIDWNQQTVGVFLQYLSGYPPKIAEYVIRRVNECINYFGVDAVAESIEKQQDKLQRFLSGIWGNSKTDADQMIADLIDGIPGVNEHDLERMEELLDEVF